MSTRRERTTALHQTIDDALGAGDPTEVNRAVTEAHHLLGVRLRATIGEGSGANFHSWATWGSRAAGRTIAQRDLPALPAAAAGAAFALTLGLAALAGSLASVPTLVLALLAAEVAACVARRETERAAEAVLAGNTLVLDDIGRVTADFVERFAPVSPRRHDDAAFEAFAIGLRPGPTEAGGQDLLRSAFGCYWRAMQSDDPAAQHQHVLAGNLHAIYHEHLRLQPCIAAALRPSVRRVFTATLLRYEVGGRRLAVGRRVEEPDPPSLVWLSDPAAARTVDLLGGGDPGAGARDWTRIEQRMRYVTGLFRSHHLCPEVHAWPYAGPPATVGPAVGDSHPARCAEPAAQGRTAVAVGSIDGCAAR